jgi:flagellar hook-length control protein FliK
MESNLSFLSTRAVAVPAAEPGAPANATSAPASLTADGRDFSEVLNGQTLKAQRQHLAAAGVPGQGLQVVPLGSHLNIITSDAPLPDMDSLAQFARMQGLDEGAVQALFGVPSASPSATLGVLTPAQPGPQDLASALASAASGFGLGASMPTPSNVAATAPDEAKAKTDAPDAALVSSLAIPAALALKDISVSLGAMPAAMGLAAGAAVAPGAPSPLSLAAAATQTSLLPLSAQAWVGSAIVSPMDASAAAAPLAPEDAVRLTLGMPAPEITKRLAHMSGTGKEATWAALLASGPVAKNQPTALETVALEVPAGLDLEALLGDNGRAANDLSAQAAAGAPAAAPGATSAGSTSNGDTAQAQADQRAQQFQQLADKMGQAAAQRLIAQIERGQWKMQMRMQPAALGSINVELDMHAGGLDALFSTDNAATRELMAQGSNKLRDTLTQAGMTVASVTVNAEQGGQSGGNSTPGKGRGQPSGVRQVSAVASASVAAPQSGPSAASDGLNVLA